jgi:hypothetical protein
MMEKTVFIWFRGLHKIHHGKLSKCTRKYKSFSVLIELSGLGDYIISIIGSNSHSLGGYETFSAPIVFQLVYGRFCNKFPQSRIKDEQHRLSPLSL